ncbi:hypothetical protein NCC78_27600, partial [Micromonospora phytophila]|uniref:hypothetical protein n=1 Tax=Micromonospora phytophila TaxID=709888 RepID=UPI00202EF0EE
MAGRVRRVGATRPERTYHSSMVGVSAGGGPVLVVGVADRVGALGGGGVVVEAGVGDGVGRIDGVGGGAVGAGPSEPDRGAAHPAMSNAA